MKSPRSFRRLGRFRLSVAVIVAVAIVALGGTAGPVAAQTVVPPANTFPKKDVTVVVSIPANQIPNNVTGFRVQATCSLIPGTADGLSSAVSPVVSAGVTLTFPTTYNDTTLCNFRLTVLGTGARPLLLTSNSVDGANVGFRYLDVVDGVTVDPQTVIEIGPLLVKALSTIRFGAPAPAPTTTTTTTTPTTTTAPPTTTTTVAPPTTQATLATVVPTLAPVVTAPPVRRAVRICVKRVKGRCTRTRLVIR
jgi:hypothetical protein